MFGFLRDIPIIGDVLDASDAIQDWSTDWIEDGGGVAQDLVEFNRHVRTTFTGRNGMQNDVSFSTIDFDHNDYAVYSQRGKESQTFFNSIYGDGILENALPERFDRIEGEYGYGDWTNDAAAAGYILSHREMEDIMESAKNQLVAKRESQLISDRESGGQNSPFRKVSYAAVADKAMARVANNEPSTSTDNELSFVV